MQSSLKIFFYIFSGVVSLVGVNFHFGVTFYLPRLLIIVFFIGLLLKLSFRAPSFYLHINKLAVVFGALFLLILFQHSISVVISERVSDGLRQIFIYASVMILFIIIININLQTTTIIKGLKIFLAIGLLQACYGIYQVLGGPFSLPAYQSFMFWPTSNDKTVDGFLYSGSYKLFRATGFFPGDVSHYATYMVTIVILTISFIMTDPRSKYLKIVFFISVIALLLSLSRSGLLALILFGLPTLFFLAVKLKVISNKFYSNFFLFLCGLTVFLMFIGPIIFDQISFDIIYFFETITRRFDDIVNAGVDLQGSMSIHLLTRFMALDAFASSPLFGVGLGVNASPWFSEAYNAGWAGSHSHHLDILGQTGIIGALLEWFFMLLVGQYMWRGLKLKRTLNHERALLIGLFSAFISIIFGNLLYHYFLNDFVWYLMGAGVALSRAMILDSNKKQYLMNK
jgi:hypothetical protein